MQDYVFTIEHGNTTTYIALDAVIAITVGLIILLAFILSLWMNKRRENDKDAWVSTTAVLTGKKNEYMDSANAGGYLHTPAKNVEYEIEYWAEGKRYVKWIQIVPVEDEGTEIAIEYYKKKPSRFREL